jgi:hypothetical protein
MGNANLLNTSTINLIELIGNGKVFHVPPYQRDYSWEEEQWEDLWNDLVELRGKPDERHYMGALVVESRNDRAFSIIDGQQRIATLSIFALAVLSKIKDLADSGQEQADNTARIAELRSRFIGEKDPASLIENSKLKLNQSDDPFYQDYLVQLRSPLNPKNLPRSNRQLWDCFKYFRDRLERANEVVGSGVELARLLSETVARQLLFILIKVDDELNAYTVFETLNARGLELSSTDLLKNYLFSRIRVSADLEALQRRWRSLIQVVQQERFPEFLRFHMLCDLPGIRIQRLFKLMRDRVKTAEDTFGLMEELEGRGEFFAALSDPAHAYWQENPDCRKFIRELNLFRVKQVTPLLFAAWERFSREDFAKILKMVRDISFRYTVVGGLNPNALESVYHQAAKAVLNRTATSPAQVFPVLKPVYVNDTKFQQDFFVLNYPTYGQPKKLVKYILARLETDLSGRACDPETDPGTIEHILPENPSEVWDESFPKLNQDDYLYCLGNLTLLESSLNRRIGNGSYREKIDLYRQSAYALTKTLPDSAPEEWTPEHVDARQKRFAERAVHLWRVDYD